MQVTQSKNYKEALSHPIFPFIQKAASKLESEVFAIGGFVRDYLLQRGTSKDIDIVTTGSGIDLAREVARLLPSGPKVQVFQNLRNSYAAISRYRNRICRCP